MRRVYWIPIFLLAGVVVFGVSTQRSTPETAGIGLALNAPISAVSAEQAYVLPIANSGSAPIRNTQVADPVIDANEALLIHLESDEVLYERNAAVRVPVASLTKLLSALVVRDLFAPDTVVTVASTSIRVDGQKQTLYNGEHIFVRDLVAMMLVESSNDAAAALAAYARGQGMDFIGQMNEKAYELGMRDCTFKDPAGLDDTAYCTANDLLRLVRAALVQAPELWPIMATQQLTVRSADGDITHEVKSTDELLGQFAGIIGGKTGNTDGALGCLILVVQLPENRGTLVSIVLGSRTRFQDTRTLVDWAQRAFRW